MVQQSMKRYFYRDGSGQVIVGTDRQIRSLYKRMSKKWDEYTPTFCDFPKFRKCGMYGIALDNNGWFHVVSSDTIVALLADDLMAGYFDGEAVTPGTTAYANNVDVDKE